MKTIAPKVLTLVVFLFTPLLQAQTTTPPPTSSTSTPTIPPPPPIFPSTIPENGLWWNPQDSGTSYSITTQNNVLFIAALTYDQNGNPTWLTGSVQILAASPESDGSNILAIDLLESTGGSCLGCPEKAPQTRNSGKQIFLSFSDQGHGQLTIDNKQMNIVPFNFYGAGLARLAGTWEVNYFSPSISIGGLDQISTIIHSFTLDSSRGNLAGSSILNVTVPFPTIISLIQQTADPDMFLVINRQLNQQGLPLDQFRIGIYVLEGLNRLIGVYILANVTNSAQDIVNQFIPMPPALFTAGDSVSMGIQINSSSNALKNGEIPPDGPLNSIASKVEPLLDIATLAKIKTLILNIALSP